MEVEVDVEFEVEVEVEVEVEAEVDAEFEAEVEAEVEVETESLDHLQACYMFLLGVVDNYQVDLVVVYNFVVHCYYYN